MKAVSIALAAALIVCSAHASTPAPGELQAALAASPDAVRGAALYSTCAACHGEDGGGVSDGSVPMIAGQPLQVLIRQLVDFRGAGLRDIRMQHFADRRHLERAQDLADVAAHIALLEPPGAAGVGDGSRVSAGASLYFARCESCHGPSGHSDAARGVPTLGGQHAAYTQRQLTEAAQGARPYMGERHRRPLSGLAPGDISAIADYLSRLPRRSSAGG